MAIQTLLVKLGIDYTYGRILLSGILDEIHLQRDLRVRLVRSNEELAAAMAKETDVAAVIGMLWNGDIAGSNATACPLSVSFANIPIPAAAAHVVLDDPAIGAMAARELRQLGLRRLAVYCPQQHHHFTERCRGFMEECIRLDPHAPPPSVFNKVQDLNQWDKLAGKPAGVFAVNDIHARELISYCEETGIDVPEQVSVLGVDNDELFVHLGGLQLSSIQLPFREMGRESVRMVRAGRRCTLPPRVQMQPIGVIHRETTGSASNFPPLVRRYIDLLRRERPLPANVESACVNWKLPRRSLELACLDTLQQSPGELLKQARIKLAQRLQAQGYDPNEITFEVGFQQQRSLRKLLDSVPCSYTLRFSDKSP